MSDAEQDWKGPCNDSTEIRSRPRKLYNDFIKKTIEKGKLRTRRGQELFQPVHRLLSTVRACEVKETWSFPKKKENKEKRKNVSRKEQREPGKNGTNKKIRFTKTYSLTNTMRYLPVRISVRTRATNVYMYFYVCMYVCIVCIYNTGTINEFKKIKIQFRKNCMRARGQMW